MLHTEPSVIPSHTRPTPAVSRATGGALSGNVEWLIDNSAAYERLLASIRGARRSVRLSQLAFDGDCVAHSDSQPDLAEGRGGSVLIDALLGAARRVADMHVRVLLNASLLLDTSKTLRRLLDGKGDAGQRIQVRGVSLFPQLLHAKLMVVDDREAFLIGSPFVNGYWDDSRHRPVDARRPSRELGGRPLHDLSVRITGHAVADLSAIFDRLWDESRPTGGEPISSRKERRSAATRAHARVEIASTVPLRLLPGMPDGATQILDAFLRGIARARSLIYIEHQYLSSRPVIAALAAALVRAPELEVIAVLNQNPDVTAYRGWQNARLRESGLLHHPRVGLFALWSGEPAETRPPTMLLNQVFVHSKVLTVDDGWATVGSANLDGVSLHSYGDDFSSALGRRVFRDVRNIDVNVVLDDDVGAGASARPVLELRSRLWAEHLGERAAVSARPAEGWLQLWREGAARSVAALNRGTVDTPSFILPYSERATPARQLADVGVRSLDGAIDLRFNPGWLEVHCSPGWVRNMFA